MGVAVITDGAAALPSDLLEKFNISVAPIRTILNGEDVTGEDVPRSDLLAGKVSTSAPSPGDFARLASEPAASAGAVICTVSRALSGSYQAALAAVSRCGGAVEVVDTTSAAGGQALVVLAAAAASAAGGDRGAVLSAALAAARRVRLVGMLESLTQLVRSGRIPRAAGWAGGRLGVHPIFEIRGGSIRRLAPALSTHNARRRILASWRSTRPPTLGAQLHAAVSHAGAEDAANELLKAVSEEGRLATSFVADFPDPLLVSAGTGALGLAWWWEGDAGERQSVDESSVDDLAER